MAGSFAHLTAPFVYESGDAEWPSYRGIVIAGGWETEGATPFNDLWWFDLTNVGLTPCPWVELNSAAIPGGGRAGAAFAVRDGFEEGYLSGGFEVGTDEVAPSEDVYKLDLTDMEAGFTLVDTMESQDVDTRLEADSLCSSVTVYPHCYMVSYLEDSTGNYCVYDEIDEDEVAPCDGSFVVPDRHYGGYSNHAVDTGAPPDTGYDVAAEYPSTWPSDVYPGQTVTLFSGCNSDPECTGDASYGVTVKGRARHAMMYDLETDEFLIIGGAWGCEGSACPGTPYIYGDEGRPQSLHMANLPDTERWDPAGGSVMEDTNWRPYLGATNTPVEWDDWPDIATLAVAEMGGARFGVEWDGDGFGSVGLAPHVIGGTLWQEMSPKMVHELVQTGEILYHDNLCADDHDPGFDDVFAVYNDETWTPYHPVYQDGDPLSGVVSAEEANFEGTIVARRSSGDMEPRSVADDPGTRRAPGVAMRDADRALVLGGWGVGSARHDSILEVDLSGSTDQWYDYGDMVRTRAGMVAAFDPVTRMAYAALGTPDYDTVERIVFDDSIVPNETSTWTMGEPALLVELVTESEFRLGAEFEATHACTTDGCFANILQLVVATQRELDDAAFTVEATLPDGDVVEPMVLDATVPESDRPYTAVTLYFPADTIADGEVVALELSWTEVPERYDGWKALVETVSPITEARDASEDSTFFVNGMLAAVGSTATDAYAIAPLTGTWSIWAPSNYLASGPGALTRPAAAGDPWTFTGIGGATPLLGADAVVIFEDAVEVGDVATGAGTVRVIRSGNLAPDVLAEITTFVSGPNPYNLGTRYTRLASFLGTQPQPSVTLAILKLPGVDEGGYTVAGTSLVGARYFDGSVLPIDQPWQFLATHELAHQWIGWHGLVAPDLRIDSNEYNWWAEGLTETAAWRAGAEYSTKAPMAAMRRAMSFMTAVPQFSVGDEPPPRSERVAGYELPALIMTDFVWLSGGALNGFWSGLQAWSATRSPGDRIMDNTAFRDFIEASSGLNLPGAYTQWAGDPAAPESNTRHGMPLLRIESIALDGPRTTLSIGVGQVQHDMSATWTEAYTMIPFVLRCSREGDSSTAVMTSCSSVEAPAGATTFVADTTHEIVSDSVDPTYLGAPARVGVQIDAMPYLHPVGLLNRTTNLSGVKSLIAWCESPTDPACLPSGDTDLVPSGFVVGGYDCNDSDGLTYPFKSAVAEAGGDKNCDGWKF